jgi:hypothetical protein
MSTQEAIFPQHRGLRALGRETSSSARKPGYVYIHNPKGLGKASCPTASRTRNDLLQAKNSSTRKQQQNTNYKLKNPTKQGKTNRETTKSNQYRGVEACCSGVQGKTRQWTDGGGSNAEKISRSSRRVAVVARRVGDA